MDRTMQAALKASIPILLGYVFMGAAFGLLLVKEGFAFYWAFIISAAVYSGSMQFVAIGLLAAGFHPLNALMLTLAVNSRHIFYGISLIDQFKNMGPKRFFMIFALTDETYSLLCSAKVPKTMDEGRYFFFIALFNYIYWIFGCTAGAILGNLIPFDTTGVDFAMTALFIVIVTDQWRQAKTHLPACIGAGCACLCLLIFGKGNFVFPALLLVSGGLLLARGQVEKKMEKGRAGE